MNTITFYSYKGGVGRTLALANIASYLLKFGLNVFIIDFDLEAPGVHYKFPSMVRNINKGLIDYIYEFTNNANIPSDLDEFVLNFDGDSDKRGHISLMPAGNVFSSSYWRKLSSIDWHDLFYKSGDGIPFFLELKEKIKEQFNPDFLLIDSRTGVTEMSSLCTSILPDKVVFLAANNRENIEGARQIFRAIQNFERLPNQDPLEVVFALTRLPVLENISNEKQITENIRSYLNEPIDNISSPIEVKDICVLHSDRELEITETLIIDKDKSLQNTPLIRDYLKLFSKIIPDQTIERRLSLVLDDITENDKLFIDPDKVQQELEQLAEGYRHSLTMERLLDFYFLRNVELKKVLSVFHDLWKTYGIEKPELLKKYVLLFLKSNLSYWSDTKFELEIVDKYCNINPDERIQIKLANAYKDYRKYDEAISLYEILIDKISDKKAVVEGMLNVFNSSNVDYFERAQGLFREYDNIISNDIGLQILKLKLLLKYRQYDELENILDERLCEEVALKEPGLYFEIFENLGKSENAISKLDTLIDIAIRKDEMRTLYEIGEIFYQVGKKNDFKEKMKLSQNPSVDGMLNDLERSFSQRQAHRRYKY